MRSIPRVCVKTGEEECVMWWEERGVVTFMGVEGKEKGRGKRLR
jgi:hypothetical protein